MTNEDYRARIAYLQGRKSDVLFPRDIHGKIVVLVRCMQENLDDIEIPILDFDVARLPTIDAVLSTATPDGANLRVHLSLLDMFDLECISLLAERDLKAIVGEEPAQWTREEGAALTSALESLRGHAFPKEDKE